MKRQTCRFFGLAGVALVGLTVHCSTGTGSTGQRDSAIDLLQDGDQDQDTEEDAGEAQDSGQTDGPSACPSGMTRCSGACVDTDTDPEHCGQCEVSCLELPEADTCQNGYCRCSLDGLTKATAPRSCGALNLLQPQSLSGVYWVDPDGPGSKGPLQAYCDMERDGGGWTVVDYQRDPGWKSYFSSWGTYAGGAAAGPAANGSCTTWREWFLADTDTTAFRLSPLCAGIEGTRDKIYRMTGNHYGCLWYNDNCDQTGSDCWQCTDDYGTQSKGTCLFWVYDPSYDYCHDCANDWWNTGPSIGTQGAFCVAFRQMESQAICEK